MTMVLNSEYSRVDSGSLSMRTDATTTTGSPGHIPIRLVVSMGKTLLFLVSVVFVSDYSFDHGCRVTEACSRFSVAGR